MSNTNHLWVRVAPLNQRTGDVVQNLVTGGRKFSAGNWYMMDKGEYEKLTRHTQPNGKPVFQAFSEEEAQEVQERENLEAALGHEAVARMAQLKQRGIKAQVVEPADDPKPAVVEPEEDLDDNDLQAEVPPSLEDDDSEEDPAPKRRRKSRKSQ